jgi:hypothetical protein
VSAFVLGKLSPSFPRLSKIVLSITVFVIRTSGMPSYSKASVLIILKILAIFIILINPREQDNALAEPPTTGLPGNLSEFRSLNSVAPRLQTLESWMEEAQD